MPKACSDYQEELSALLDSELHGDEKAEVSGHIAECSDCAARFETIKSLSGFISRESAEIETPDIWDMLKDELPSVCEVIEEDLSAYLDGELPPASQEGVNQHLKDCEVCLDKFKLLNSTNQLLSKGLALPDHIEVDLWDGIKAQISSECETVIEEMSAFVDQAVDSARHRAITSHLIECVPCRNRFDDMSKVGDLLREHYKPQIPENLNLWPGIKSKMPSVIPFTPRQSTAKKKVRPRFAVIIGAAAAVVGLLGGLTYWLSMPDDIDFPTISAESYLIESSFEEPADLPEAVVYE